jgi:hypothetical protein
MGPRVTRVRGQPQGAGTEPAEGPGGHTNESNQPGEPNSAKHEASRIRDPVAPGRQAPLKIVAYFLSVSSVSSFSGPGWSSHGFACGPGTMPAISGSSPAASPPVCPRRARASARRAAFPFCFSARARSRSRFPRARGFRVAIQGHCTSVPETGCLRGIPYRGSLQRFLTRVHGGFLTKVPHSGSRGFLTDSPLWFTVGLTEAPYRASSLAFTVVRTRGSSLGFVEPL